VERGSDLHGPRQDDALKAELSGLLGSSGGHREEWADPEPPADDDPELHHDRAETGAVRDRSEATADGAGTTPSTPGGGSIPARVDQELTGGQGEA
jgi:hypothetical protein